MPIVSSGEGVNGARSAPENCAQVLYTCQNHDFPS
jgi:hypothetical protein